ncbi:MAG: hypothetical protein IKH39_01595 [Candidatus Methanomethylophilaceae archaeon]|nr:hypothetical protein [Candidatus Methanomethylophilaceae archaeon]
MVAKQNKGKYASANAAKKNTRKSSPAPRKASSNVPASRLASGAGGKSRVPRDEKGRFVSRAAAGRASGSSQKKPQPSRRRTPKATSQQERLAGYVGMSGRAESIRKELYVARRIPISGGTVRKQEQVASAIADNFTMKEIEGMARLGDDLRVKVGSTENEKADASFRRKYKPDDRFVITVEDRADKMAVAHEFVHLSRVVDRSRKGVEKTVYRTGRNLVASPEQRDGSMADHLRNAEECATSAETALRVKRLGKPPAYFRDLGDKDPYTGIPKYPYAKDNMVHDRRELRRRADMSEMPRRKSIKGETAVGMMERNYSRTRISKRKKGGRTAIEVSESETGRNRHGKRAKKS